MDDVAIKVEHLSKTFKLPHEKQSSIKSAVINFRKRGYEKQEVLQDVSFEIKKGEFFGIVGRNGSGKSTLLKLLAGIYTPTKGAVKVSGKLTPFIELGVGFNPELTGRENVFLNGSLLGFNRKEMSDMYDDIVKFAELERFMDQKLKNYSSGMQVRLAFSIAIRAQSDILLLDEVLAVGDENFQRKCYDYFAQLKRKGQTVVFVSHDMSAVRDYCTNGILIDKGKIIERGDVKRVVNRYTDLNFSELEKQFDSSSTDEDDYKRWGNGDAVIEKVWTSLKTKNKATFAPHDLIEVNIQIKASKDLTAPVVGMILQDAQGRTVFATNTNAMDMSLSGISKGAKAIAQFQIENIYTNGLYTISCAIANSDRTVVYSRVEEIAKLAIGGWPQEMEHSIAHPKHSFLIKKVS